MGKKDGYGVTLESAVEFAARQKGLRIEDCAAGDVVTVETMNSVYRLRVTDPASREVEVRGTGDHFRSPVVTFVNGSSMTGTGAMVRLGWIGVGFPLWLGNVLLTPTRRILVNGKLFQEQAPDGPKVLN